MRYYPVMLDLHGRSCLLAGAGSVGLRKLATLLACDPGQVLVLDPFVDRNTADPLLDHPAVRFEARQFEDRDLDGRLLAIAASGDTALNRRIAGLCRERSILCNVVDDPEAGSFTVPAHVDMDGLIVALSTSGRSPALTRRIRRELETHLGGTLGPLIRFMGELRPLVLELGLPTKRNTELFRALVDSKLGELLARDRLDKALDLARALLPEALHGDVPRLVNMAVGLRPVE